MKEFRLLKKNYGKVQTLSVDDLDMAFRRLDAMIEQFEASRPRFFEELAGLHQAVAEQLGGIDFQEERFGRALRCYQSIVDHHHGVGVALVRIREIDDQRTKAFIRIEKYLACDDIAGCLPTVNELERKFEGDPETTDFLRNKIKPKLASIQLSTKQIQKFIDEKKWQTLDQLLDLRSSGSNSSLSDLHKTVKKKILQADEAIEQIRTAVGQREVSKAKSMLAQLVQFISDHAELNLLRSEVDFLWNHSAEIDKELGTLRQKKHWVRAENVLRCFLSTHPIKATGLVGLTDEISKGVVRYQNYLRLVLFFVLGGAVFFGISRFASIDIHVEHLNDNLWVKLLLAIAFEFFAVYIVLGFMISMLRIRADSPNTMGDWKVFLLFLCAAFFACAPLYMLTNQEQWLESVIKPRISAHDSDSVQMLLLFFLYTLLALLLCGVVYPFQYFLYGMMLRCVQYEEKKCTFRGFLHGAVLIALIMLVTTPKAHEILGNWITVFHSPGTWLLALWVSTWMVVYHDYRQERDTSFGLADLVDYVNRYRLLVQLRNDDFGKPSLVTTDWYRSVKQEANFRQQQKVLESQRQQQAATGRIQESPGPSFAPVPSRPSPQTMPTSENNTTSSGQGVSVRPKAPDPAKVYVPPLQQPPQTTPVSGNNTFPPGQGVPVPTKVPGPVKVPLPPLHQPPAPPKPLLVTRPPYEREIMNIRPILFHETTIKSNEVRFFSASFSSVIDESRHVF